MLAVTAYKGNNLSGGTLFQGDRPEAEWTYDRPGFLGAAQARAACKGEMMLSDSDVRDIIEEAVRERKDSRR